MLRPVYTLLIALASVPAGLMLRWRDRGHPNANRRWLERYGRLPSGISAVAVWVHAASVGEVLASAPLIHKLLALHGEGRVAVSCFTTTGSEQITRLWGGKVVHLYLPFDLPFAVDRFLQRLAPRVAIIIETELWPNLYRSLHRRGIPLVIANARLSERSMRGYSHAVGLIHETLAACTLVAAQSETDALRFRTLGAAAVVTTGNIKFDVEVPATQREAGLALRARLGAARPAWIAASTHEGEETAALIAHRQLLQTQPEALLIVVPRHPQRFESTWKLIEASGLRAARRQHDPIDAHTQVLLGDSMGEMFVYLGAADVAFVGGSLVAIGGHNILEPAAIGIPVLFGPHMQNFADARMLLLDSGGGIEIADAAALCTTLTNLFGDTAARRAAGDKALQALTTGRGALLRLLEAIDTTVQRTAT